MFDTDEVETDICDVTAAKAPDVWQEIAATEIPRAGLNRVETGKTELTADRLPSLSLIEPGAEAATEDPDEPASSSDAREGSPIFERAGAEAVNDAEDGETAEVSGTDRAMRERALYLQKTLIQFAPLFMALNTDSSDAADTRDLTPEQRQNRSIARHQEEVDRVKQQIKSECDSGRVGPATERAYRQYVQWLEKAVPTNIRRMQALGLPLPPGSQLMLSSENGQPMEPQLFTRLASLDRISLNLPTSFEAMQRSDTLIDKLDAVFDWLATCNREETSARARIQDNALNSLITRMELPSSWRKQDGDNPETWRAAASQMIELSVTVRNYIEAMQSLYKSSRNSDFPIELPQGAQLKVTDSTGREHTLSGSDLNTPENRQIFRDGRITEIKLDQPTDLRLASPANQNRVGNLQDWLDRVGTRIDQAAGQIHRLQRNPDAIIMFGDKEVQNGKALINASGEFVRIVPSDYRSQPGENIRNLNLLGYNFEVTPLTQGADAGKFRISQSITAENAAWYAYQNIRIPGLVEPVGKMNVGDQVLDGNDFVPVRSGEKVQLVQVKNLQSFKEMQQAFYYGEKGLSMAMDGAMLVSGSIEVGVAMRAAARGSRLAAAGGETLLQLSRREAAKEIAKGSVRVMVAGSGIFNNAGARQTTWGQGVNAARGLYFLGDVSLGLGRGTWSALRAGRSTEAASSAQRLHTLIHGREASNGVEALKGIGWVKQIHTGTQFTFRATECGFAPLIAADLLHQVDELQESAHADPTRSALRQIGNGRGEERAPRAVDRSSSGSLEGVHAVLDVYRNTLRAGRSTTAAGEISEIFNRTKSLMRAETAELSREAYRQELLAKICFTPEQIIRLEQSHPQASEDANFKLSNEDIRALLDHDYRNLLSEERKRHLAPLTALAAEFLSSKDSDVVAASRIALLCLSFGIDGRTGPDAGRARIELPAYNREIERGRKSASVSMDARTIEWHFTSAAAVSALRSDLAAPNLGNRGLVTGDMLTRLGALTHQSYAAVLLDVLRNPSAAKTDKIRALSDTNGLAIIIEGLQREERASTNQTETDRESAGGRSHGLTSEALLKQVEEIARADRDEDVRALAAMTLFGSRENNRTRRTDILNQLARLASGEQRAGRTCAQEVSGYLLGQLEAAIPEQRAEQADAARATRLNSALALACITRTENAEQQSLISKAIVRSFSPTDIALSNRVIDSLLSPARATETGATSRIEGLVRTNPELITSLRRAAVDLIRTPNAADQNRAANESALIACIALLNPLLRGSDAETERQFQTRLQELLRNSQTNPGYAGAFQNLRVAAIESLAMIGSRESLEIIRSHTSAQSQIRVADRSINAGENDGAVRLAAVKVLHRLQDPELPVLLNSIVDSETDAAIAQRIRDSIYALNRPEHASRDWQRFTNAAQYRALQTPEVLRREEVNAFFEQNDLRLLVPGNYRREAEAELTNATNFFWRQLCTATRYTDSVNLVEENSLREGKYAERREQWRRLAELATRGGTEGDKAITALYFFASQNRGITDAEAPEFKGYYDESHRHRLPEPDWQLLASVALSRQAVEGKGNMELLKGFVERGLTNNSDLPSRVRSNFLDAWRALRNRDLNGSFLSVETAAEAIQTAFWHVNSHRDNESRALQQKMLEDLHNLNYPRLAPMLEGMLRQQERLDPQVRQSVQRLYSRIVYSTGDLWNSTVPDNAASPQVRATILAGDLAKATDAEAAVKAIFAAYKGHKIKDGDDVDLLARALNDSNQRIRLASSRVLVNSDLSANNPVRLLAIQTLASLALSGTNETYCREAHSLLCGMGNSGNSKIAVSRANKLYNVEPCEHGVKVTEATRIGSTWHSTGVVYPNGSMFRCKLNEDGALTEVWEDGIHWRRNSRNGNLSTEWTNTATGARWKGVYTELVDGTYQYQTEGSSRAFRRGPDGSLLAVAGPFGAS
ncbi:MAG: hypothetical protein K2W95_34645 [Candidatus Obscuribacterales bacterium]|nr:hypothetical protein [Candidatus Obscuribacterales bacterium]